MIARDIALVELTGGRLHIAHVSTARSVAMIRDACARGLAVSAEATPHHLMLTEEAVAEYDTNAKMALAARTQADVDALRAGLADGTIEAIATTTPPPRRRKGMRVRPRRTASSGWRRRSASGSSSSRTGRSTCRG
jgi:dihydroorotase